MTRKIIIIIVLLTGSLLSQAQLKGVFNKVKNKVDQRVDKKIDAEIEKTLDKAEGKDPAPAPSTTKSNTKPADEKVAKPEEDNSIKSYSKFDFIPGEVILY